MFECFAANGVPLSYYAEKKCAIENDKFSATKTTRDKYAKCVKNAGLDTVYDFRFVCFNEEYRDTEHERAGTVCVRVFNLLDMFAFNVPTAINATTLHI